MVAFLTPREMFYDYQEHMQYEKDEYENRMMDFQQEAIKKFSNQFSDEDFMFSTIVCLAMSYLDGYPLPKKLFEKFGLRTIHAYALQSNLNDFIQEYDEKEMSYPDYD